MDENKVQDILFIQELNSHRLELREKLDTNHEVSSLDVMDSLLKIQLLLYQNRNTIDVQEDLEENTNNLLKIVYMEHNFGAEKI